MSELGLSVNISFHFLSFFSNARAKESDDALYFFFVTVRVFP